MKLIDTDETILIVTGSDLPAEMNDRPTAYALKREIDRLGEGRPWREAVVVSDRWFADHRVFHLCSTIVIGGPGVNAVAAALINELPALVARDERVFVQGAWDSETKRVSLWGADRVATSEAVVVFLREGYCAQFLNSAWRLKPSLQKPRFDLA
jgi:hypothetical protein